MKKILLLIVAMVFVFSSACYGAPNPNNWGNTDTNPLLAKNMPYYMTHLGVANDGVSQGVSQMCSTSTAVPTDVIIAQKYIGAAAQAGTLANGVPGQILYILIDTCEAGASFVLTPTTKWGFSTLTFNAAKDSATLFYVNDYYGWLLIGSNSVTIG